MRLKYWVISITFMISLVGITPQNVIAENSKSGSFFDNMPDFTKAVLEAERREMRFNSINMQISLLKSYGKVHNWDNEKIQNGINYIQNVHAGTIGSTIGGGVISDAITAGTKYPGQMDASHALIGVDHGMFVEAGSGGQNNVHRVRAVDVYIRSMENGAQVRLQEVAGITTEEKEEAARYALKQVGKGYDMSGALFGLNFKHDYDWYCSELVYYAFKEAGVNLQTATNYTLQTSVSKTIDLTNISPQELVNSEFSGKTLELTTFDNPKDHYNTEILQQEAKREYIEICMDLAVLRGENQAKAAEEAAIEYDKTRRSADPTYAKKSGKHKKNSKITKKSIHKQTNSAGTLLKTKKPKTPDKIKTEKTSQPRKVKTERPEDPDPIVIPRPSTPPRPKF